MFMDLSQQHVVVTVINSSNPPVSLDRRRRMPWKRVCLCHNGQAPSPNFFASTNRQCKRAFSYPRLLNLHVVRDVLDKLVKGGLLYACQRRDAGNTVE